MSYTPLQAWGHETSPFHEASLALQEKLGVAKRTDAQGRRGVTPFLTEQHREFFPQLPFVAAATVDETGQPWASLLFGEPGFLVSEEPGSLHVGAFPLPGDPLEHRFMAGAPVGLLGIELPTRRRNRANGRITLTSSVGFELHIMQAFGNCPQYIHQRLQEDVEPAPAARVDLTRLDEASASLIASVDTFFIATAYKGGIEGKDPSHGVEVSHRGGKSGFVRVDNDATLTVPDFIGNFHFRTIGNLAEEPRAGLLFPNFKTGDMLFVAADAEVIWDDDEVRAFTGAQRLLRFHIRSVIRLDGAMPVRFQDSEVSPFVERTGDWDQVADALHAKSAKDIWMNSRIIDIQRESSTILSFYLEPEDGAVLPHDPGQFLPIRLKSQDGSGYLVRNYTLSAATNKNYYRISVKLDGKASQQLHSMQIGDILAVKRPAGDFVYRREAHRPIALVSAGIGITPTIAFLDALLVNQGRSLHPAQITVIHGARNGNEQAFGNLLREKARTHQNLNVHIRFSAPSKTDSIGQNHDSEGRVDTELLKKLLDLREYDFYLCGPQQFMQGIHDGLTQEGIAPGRIMSESFGPSSLNAVNEAIDFTTEVEFSLSRIKGNWTPKSGTLLEFAEALGVDIPFECRSGACGRCSTRLLSGGVTYQIPPEAQKVEGQVFLCCSIPQENTKLVLDV